MHLLFIMMDPLWFIQKCIKPQQWMIEVNMFITNIYFREYVLTIIN